MPGNGTTEASIDGWIHKRLIKMYVDFCKQLSEKPNMKVLKKLYNLEVLDDEIIVSECDLQDLSITPLINALQSQKAFSMLDLSQFVRYCRNQNLFRQLKRLIT
ncbi:hypothetical protein PIB30_006429 [Stylosanthes scabra]|uniref:Uncharacterized protein n=1 Tax=Stylosanthes scabra TaxID=79078 RepID=A0ABU6U321_9FABA|nr:hypothetical protein [Stylosanthes scabra]